MGPRFFICCHKTVCFNVPPHAYIISCFCPQNASSRSSGAQPWSHGMAFSSAEGWKADQDGFVHEILGLIRPLRPRPLKGLHKPKFRLDKGLCSIYRLLTFLLVAPFESSFFLVVSFKKFAGAIVSLLVLLLLLLDGCVIR